MRSTVRKAAKLAVYEEIRMSVKNHHTDPTMRPEMERGEMSQPCCINAPSDHQNVLKILNSLTVECWPPWPEEAEFELDWPAPDNDDWASRPSPMDTGTFGGLV